MPAEDGVMLSGRGCWVLLPGSASAVVAGRDRSGRLGRRNGGDRSASAGAGFALPAVRAGVGPHAGVGAQPVGEVAGFPAQEHVDRAVPGGQVDQHRAVLVAAAQREPSTPSTATWPTGGSGSARIIRSSVDRLAPHPQSNGQP